MSVPDTASSEQDQKMCACVCGTRGARENGRVGEKERGQGRGKVHRVVGRVEVRGKVCVARGDSRQFRQRTSKHLPQSDALPRKP
eukprot:716269-Rhodomonas_salina.1